MVIIDRTRSKANEVASSRGISGHMFKASCEGWVNLCSAGLNLCDASQHLYFKKQFSNSSLSLQVVFCL